MEDSTPESDRSFGDDAFEWDERTFAEFQARGEAEARRRRTIVTLEPEADGYTLTFRYLTAGQAARLIRLSDRVRPLPHVARRLLHRLLYAPDLLKYKYRGCRRSCTLAADLSRAFHAGAVTQREVALVVGGSDGDLRKTCPNHGWWDWLRLVRGWETLGCAVFSGKTCAVSCALCGDVEAAHD